MMSLDQELRFVSAETLPLTVVWRAFLDGFRDYLVPVQIEEQPFASLLESEHVDLTASVVALNNSDEPVGFCLLAVRGSDSWCGGLGISPSYRRRGLGRALMIHTIDRARERRFDRVRLECINGNDAALKLYLGLGFQVTRRLDLFDGVPVAIGAGLVSTPDPDVRPLVNPVSVWDDFAAYHAVPRPWQQDVPSLRLTVQAESLAGLSIGDPVQPDAYLLYRIPDQASERLSIVDAGWRRNEIPARLAFRALLASLAERHPGARLFAPNIPEEGALNEALREVGVPVTLSQSEMVLVLSSSDQSEQTAR